MNEPLGRVTIGLDRALFGKLKEIAERRRCAVDDLVDESVRVRYSIYTVEQRSAAVDEISRMDLPTGTWEEIEEEIQKGATEQ